MSLPEYDLVVLGCGSCYFREGRVWPEPSLCRLSNRTLLPESIVGRPAALPENPPAWCLLRSCSPVVRLATVVSDESPPADAFTERMKARREASDE